MKGHLFVLILGFVLGIAVALPVAALASSWPLFGSDQGKAGAESSATTQQRSPSDAASVDSLPRTSQQADQEQQEDKHKKMMEQCATMMQDMMGTGDMMSRGMSMGW